MRILPFAGAFGFLALAPSPIRRKEKRNKAWYPKSMSIKFFAQQQHSLELHFSEVEFLDELAGKEIHR